MCFSNNQLKLSPPEMVSESIKRGGEMRSYWRCRKEDFFPEPSFSSWSSYVSALAATVPRLLERAFHRSRDSDVALLVRRYYDASGKAQGFKRAACVVVVVAASAGLSGWWGWNSGGWLGYAVVGPMWLAGVVGMVAVVPQQRAPKVWGVPLVPWLPCLSITTNLFLMGSLRRRVYERFGSCTVGMLVYYLFFSLHATYNAAHDGELPEVEPEREVSNGCGGGSSPG